jgi:hypothetical protein
MPVTLTRADRRLLLAGAGVFVLLLTVTLLLSSAGAEASEHPSSYSAGSTGARAAYLLLRQIGYRVERWEQTLDEIDRPAETTLVLAEPDEPPTAASRLALERFLEAGGRVIATGMAGAGFLARTAIADPVSGLTWDRVAAASPSAITRAAPAITLAPRAYWPRHADALRLYGSVDRPFVVRFPVGAGDVIWWAAATPLTNAGLREPGNLEFLLACLGEPGERRILWDEYTHGYRRTLGASLAHSPVRWIGLQVGVFLVAILWTYARRSGPVVPAPVESRLSPLEFVRTLGSLYRRASAAAVAVDIAYERVRYRLAHRLGVPSHAPIDDVERAMERRGHDESAEVGAALRTAADARGRAVLKAPDALAVVQSLSRFWGSAKEDR